MMTNERDEPIAWLEPCLDENGRGVLRGDGWVTDATERLALLGLLDMPSAVGIDCLPSCLMGEADVLTPLMRAAIADHLAKRDPRTLERRVLRAWRLQRRARNERGSTSETEASTA